jgi:hypothetical protein
LRLNPVYNRGKKREKVILNFENLLHVDCHQVGLSFYEPVALQRASMPSGR